MMRGGGGDFEPLPSDDVHVTNDILPLSPNGSDIEDPTATTAMLSGSTRDGTERVLTGGGTSAPKDRTRMPSLHPQPEGAGKKRRRRKTKGFWGSTRGILFLERWLRFGWVKLAQLQCAALILVLTFSEAPFGLLDPKSRNIIDPANETNTESGVIFDGRNYRPVVAYGPYQKFCLAASRASAFSMYPALVLVLLTKCKATHLVFSKTPLSMFLILTESHDLHAYMGSYIAFDTCLHVFFHMLRWADQGNASLLWEHRTGLSGLIAAAFLPLIALPMILMRLKKLLRYELRKWMHYLFYVFAISLCFHVPPASSASPNGGYIAYVLGVCLIWYTVDSTYVYLFMTEKIETTAFHVLSGGVRMTLAVSDSFHKRGEKGGYAYVCLPWVDRTQWHAFSLFEDPFDPSIRQVFMLDVGDWTHSVRLALRRNTRRPVWVQGPFVSPYGTAEMYDNQILVATGIGITPALSVIRGFKSSRRINLIWSVRDPTMLEFFLDRLYLDHEGWNLIFYTGKEALNPALEDADSNIRVIKGRPNLKILIPNIIYGIESRSGLPEAFTQTGMEKMRDDVIDRVAQLDSTPGLTSTEKIADLTAYANARGFSFTELVGSMQRTLPKKASKRTRNGEDKIQSNTEAHPKRESLLLENIREYGWKSRRYVGEEKVEIAQETHPSEVYPNVGNNNPAAKNVSSNQTSRPKRRTSLILDDIREFRSSMLSNNGEDSSDDGKDQQQAALLVEDLFNSSRDVSGSNRDVLKPFNGGKGRSSRNLLLASLDGGKSRRGIIAPVDGGKSRHDFIPPVDTRKSRRKIPPSMDGGKSRRNVLPSLDERKSRRSNFASLKEDGSRGRDILASLKGGLLTGQASVLKSSFEPWEKVQGARSYVRELDEETVLSTWGILYCGGSKAVEDMLKQVSTDYKVSLRVETFSW